MATYRLVFTRTSGGQSTNLAEFPDDAAIIADTRLVLSDEVTSIAIGRGGQVCELEWIGAWDWCDGEPSWAPAE